LLVVPASTAAEKPPAPAEMAWSFNLDAKTDSSPAIGPDGTIYVGDFKGKFLALNPEGSRKWEFSTGHGWNLGVEIKSSPAIGADGTIYFGCRDNLFYALRPDGKQKWAFKTGAWVDSSPAVAGDGSVCFGSWDHNFYCLDQQGSEKWRFQTGGAIDSSPAIGDDGVIYFGSHDKKFYALAPDGRKKWEFAAGGQIISSPAVCSSAKAGETSAPPANSCVYFTSVNGWFYALNLDGRLRWRLHTGGCTQSSPVIGPQGTIYVGVNRELWAISADGKKLWAHPTDLPVEAAPLVLSDDSVCFVSHGGWLFDVAPDGTRRWSLFLNVNGGASPVTGGPGILYAGKEPAFQAWRTGVQKAGSCWPKFRGNARNTGNVRDSLLATGRP
jgi:outer membrane protein assembly factor BamB